MRDEKRGKARNTMVTSTVKSTVNIQTAYFEELKNLVSEKAIASMTEGINLGIGMLIREKRKETYMKQMEEAAKDRDFIERTMKAQCEFDKIDAEVSGQW